MEVANCLHVKLEQILSRLKFLRVIRSYTLRIEFGEVDEDFRECLREIDILLKKCIEKINSKPRRAEIRNVISELVRKKNTEQTRIKLGFPRGNLPLSCRNKLGDMNDSLFNKKKKESCRIKCANCSQRFKTENDLKVHFSSHPKTEGCLCEFCGDLFGDFSSYEFHIFKIHCPELDFICEKCFQSYSSFEELERHLKIHSENICQQEFIVNNSREDLSTTVVEEPLILSSAVEKSNKKSHSDKFSMEKSQKKGEFKSQDLNKVSQKDGNSMVDEEQKKGKSSKPISVPCENCGRLFEKEKSLKKHISLKHSDKVKRFQCDICEKSFLERGKLNRHLKIHQTGDLKCSHCSRTFCRMDNLKRHTRLSHGNAQPFECKFCRKKFSLKHNRDAHEENIHDGMIIQCELCGQKCKNKGTFRIHRKIHEGNIFSCTLCSKTFTRKEQYRNHWKSKHKGFSPFQKLFDSFVKRDLDAVADVTS